jgi:peptide-methionine (S)-S-oxide reductase
VLDRHAPDGPILTAWLAPWTMVLAGCIANQPTPQRSVEEEPTVTTTSHRSETPEELATLGAGCFWCVEAVFQQLDGVLSVESGYAGGHVPDPTYQQVCEGDTGHAEVCRIRFDPGRLSFDKLLEVFWKVHDPTTANRQGHDVGPQYRSVVFYHDDRQKELAERYKRALDESGAYRAPIVTEISPLTNYYRAEDYHQNYFRSNPYQGYCRVVIQPKVEEFRKVFAKRLKRDE